MLHRQSNIYVLSNISMQPSYFSWVQINCTGGSTAVYFSTKADCISPPEQSVFLHQCTVYFSTRSQCISPPQRSVAETSQQQIWSVSKSLTDPIKVDRDATNYDKERLRNRSQRNLMLSVLKGAAGNEITLSIPTRNLRPYKSSFSGHCLAMAMTLKLDWYFNFWHSQ